MGVDVAELATAQGQGPFAVALGVDPADRAGVAAPVHALNFGDQVPGDVGGGAAHRSRGVQGGGQGQGRSAGVGDAGDVGGQVQHVGQFQHVGGVGNVHARAVGLHGLGHRRDGVFVFAQVLGRRAERLGEHLGVLGVDPGAANGAGQHP